jgi:hypothetical protein
LDSLSLIRHLFGGTGNKHIKGVGLLRNDIKSNATHKITDYTTR